jgi:hypothetical protein
MCIVELKCHLDLVYTQDRDDTSTPQYTYYTHKIEMTLQLHNTHILHTQDREVSSRSCVCSMCIMELKCHLDLVCLVCVLYILHTQDRDDTSTLQYTYYTHKIEMTLQLHNTHTTHTRSRWHFNSTIHILHTQDRDDTSTPQYTYYTHKIEMTVYCGVEVSSRSCVCIMCIVELKCHLDLVCVVCVLWSWTQQYTYFTHKIEMTLQLHNTHTKNTRSRWHFNSIIHILHTQDRDDTSTPQYTYYTHKIEMTLCVVCVLWSWGVISILCA